MPHHWLTWAHWGPWKAFWPNVVSFGPTTRPGRQSAWISPIQTRDEVAVKDINLSALVFYDLNAALRTEVSSTIPMKRHMANDWNTMVRIEVTRIIYLACRLSTTKNTYKSLVLPAGKTPSVHKAPQGVLSVGNASLTHLDTYTGPCELPLGNWQQPSREKDKAEPNHPAPSSGIVSTCLKLCT
jgi:hypothetical protein